MFQSTLLLEGAFCGGKGYKKVGGDAHIAPPKQHLRSVLFSAVMSKPSGRIRSLPLLSAWGLQRRLLPLPVFVTLIFGCFLVQVVEGVLQKEPLGMCRGRCPHRPADLPEDSNFLVQPCRNRPAEFARCPRCPPGACQRRLLPLPVFVTLIFRCFLVQVVNFIFTAFASLSVYRLSCTTDFTRSYASFFLC